MTSIYSLIPAPELPSELTGAATCIAQSSVYLHGGFSGPLPIRHCTIAELHSAFSARTARGEPIILSDELFVLNVIDRKWVCIKPKGNSPRPAARMMHALAACKSCVYLFGGIRPDANNPSGFRVLDDFWVFDLARNRWYEIHPQSVDGESLGPMPNPRFGHSLMAIPNLPVSRSEPDAEFMLDAEPDTAAPDSRDSRDSPSSGQATFSGLLVVGGKSDTDTDVADMAVFSLTTGMWLSAGTPMVAPLPQTRSASPAEPDDPTLSPRARPVDPLPVQPVSVVSGRAVTCFYDPRGSDPVLLSYCGTSERISDDSVDAPNVLSFPFAPSASHLTAVPLPAHNRADVPRVGDMPHISGGIYGDYLFVAGPVQSENAYCVYFYHLGSGGWSLFDCDPQNGITGAAGETEDSGYSGKIAGKQKPGYSSFSVTRKRMKYKWGSFIWSSHHKLIILGSKTPPMFPAGPFTQTFTTMAVIDLLTHGVIALNNSIFSPEALDLGKDALQRFGPSISDFELVSTAGVRVPASLAVLRYRWGRHFESLLLEAYGDSVRNFLAGDSDLARKRRAVLANQHARRGKRGSGASAGAVVGARGGSGSGTGTGSGSGSGSGSFGLSSLGSFTPLSHERRPSGLSRRSSSAVSARTARIGTPGSPRNIPRAAPLFRASYLDDPHEIMTRKLLEGLDDSGPQPSHVGPFRKYRHSIAFGLSGAVAPMTPLAAAGVPGGLKLRSRSIVPTGSASGRAEFDRTHPLRTRHSSLGHTPSFASSASTGSGSSLLMNNFPEPTAPLPRLPGCGGAEGRSGEIPEVLEPFLVPRALYLPLPTDTVVALLEYLYTSTLNPGWSVGRLLELYVAARHYRIGGLEAQIAVVLEAVLSSFEALLLAHVHVAEGRESVAHTPPIIHVPQAESPEPPESAEPRPVSLTLLSQLAGSGSVPRRRSSVQPRLSHSGRSSLGGIYGFDQTLMLRKASRASVTSSHSGGGSDSSEATTAPLGYTMKGGMPGLGTAQQSQSVGISLQKLTEQISRMSFGSLRELEEARRSGEYDEMLHVVEMIHDTFVMVGEFKLLIRALRVVDLDREMRGREREKDGERSGRESRERLVRERERDRERDREREREREDKESGVKEEDRHGSRDSGDPLHRVLGGVRELVLGSELRGRRNESEESLVRPAGAAEGPRGSPRPSDGSEQSGSSRGWNLAVPAGRARNFIDKTVIGGPMIVGRGMGLHSGGTAFRFRNPEVVRHRVDRGSPSSDRPASIVEADEPRQLGASFYGNPGGTASTLALPTETTDVPETKSKDTDVLPVFPASGPPRRKFLFMNKKRK